MEAELVFVLKGLSVLCGDLENELLEQFADIRNAINASQRGQQILRVCFAKNITCERSKFLINILGRVRNARRPLCIKNKLLEPIAADGFDLYPRRHMTVFKHPIELSILSERNPRG
jgi:hypothetical protein